MNYNNAAKAYKMIKALANPFSQAILRNPHASFKELSNKCFGTYSQLRKCKDDLTDAGFFDKEGDTLVPQVDKCVRAVNKFLYDKDISFR